ncbi:hypothetical protein IIV6-T1_292 [Invertebrate iridescent virus 6]|nr:hypothetical protein IIV6-T1_292 [Invertebrate iridescent virus 6]
MIENRLNFRLNFRLNSGEIKFQLNNFLKYFYLLQSYKSKYLNQIQLTNFRY